MTTRTEARDDMLGLINTALSGEDVTIHWPGVAQEKPEASETWIRITVQHLAGGQSALGHVDGLRRYRHQGVLYAEIYSPMGDGLSADDDLAILLLDAVKAARTTNGVILRNAKAREGGPDGGWHKTVVQADFEYDEVS